MFPTDFQDPSNQLHDMVFVTPTQQRSSFTQRSSLSSQASQVTPALPVHVNRHLHDLVAEAGAARSRVRGRVRPRAVPSLWTLEALGDVGRVAESQGHMEKLVYMEKLQDVRMISFLFFFDRTMLIQDDSFTFF